jgi:serine/threonine protein kinase
VRFKILGIDNIDEAALRGMLTPVMSHTITQADGTTLCVIKTARFQNLDFYSLKEVSIIGFGRAFAESLPRSTLQQRPTPMVFPELLFGVLPSKKSDVWQLACLLFLVQAQVLPFRITKGYNYLLWELTRYLGPIPDSWEGKYQWSKYKIILPLGRICDWDLNVWFDEEQPTRTLETSILVVEHGKAREMAALLHKMLAWEPEKRPRSGEVYQEVLQWRLSG